MMFPGIAMERFAGQSLWRSVVSHHLFRLACIYSTGGKHPDGACEYTRVSALPVLLKGQWVMERWMSPEDFAGKRGSLRA